MVGVVVIVIANKKGVNIFTYKFTLKLFIGCVPIIIIPFLLSDIPIKGKLIVTPVALAIGLVAMTLAYKIGQNRRNKK